MIACPLAGKELSIQAVLWAACCLHMSSACVLSLAGVSFSQAFHCGTPTSSRTSRSNSARRCAVSDHHNMSMSIMGMSIIENSMSKSIIMISTS